jgi:hypothetical protein
MKNQLLYLSLERFSSVWVLFGIIARSEPLSACASKKNHAIYLKEGASNRISQVKEFKIKKIQRQKAGIVYAKL